MTAELERYKTTCLAQEAEIARLQDGFNELKQYAKSFTEVKSVTEWDRGFDRACKLVVSKINRITGESK